MTREEFEQCLNTLSYNEIEILSKKGKEYSRSEDVLANFKRLAETMNVSIEKVWGIYFMKHIDAILYWIANGKTGSEETVQGRIMDARNYLALLNAIFLEKAKVIEELTIPIGKHCGNKTNFNVDISTQPPF